MNIRTKIFLWYAGLLTLIIVGFSIAVFGVIQAAIVSSIDSELAQTSSNLIQNIGIIRNNHLETLDTDVVFRNDEIFRLPGLSIQVWQTYDGNTSITPTLIQSSLDLRGMTTALDPSTLRAGFPTFNNVNANNMRERVITHPFMTIDGQQIGVLQIASSIMIVDQITDGILKAMIITAVAGLIISIGLDMLVSYHTLQPIQKITTAVACISTTDDLTTRLPDNIPDDEIGRLTRAFNHMMARLEHLFGVQQRFVTDLSHELRTPLTTIQGNLDIIQKYGSDETSIQAIRMEANRLTRMINEVLILARADYGGIDIDLYPFDIDHALLLESFNRISASAHIQERNLDLQLDKHHQSMTINGNQERLQQVVCNLLMNAIRFTPEGGTISVSIYQREQHGIIEITDTGIGIPKENLDHIFDPFYRVDDSRTRISDQDGAGLGLSIVKWIVDAHHGKIEVESEINIGTTVRVILPLLKEYHRSNNSDNKAPQHSTAAPVAYHHNQFIETG